MNTDFDMIQKLFNIDLSGMTAYPTHEGGRNAVYRAQDMVIRISKSSDRTYMDQLAETEYVHYLYQGKANTVDAINSVNGRRVELVNGAFVSVFTVAKGDQIAEHGYSYREGAPLSEYFFNTGKVLGRIHALSKVYKPENRRFDFFEKYNEAYFDELISDEYIELKGALADLLCQLRALPRSTENYGMVHFDFSDGNYNIDYATGDITVFDFENCRTCFYMFDLANLWTHGVGWIAYEPSAEKRKAFMVKYFETILSGYRTETELSDEECRHLPLFIKAVLMENIVDEFEVQRAETGKFENNEEQAYRIECMVKNMDYLGFLDETYNPDSPFEKEL